MKKFIYAALCLCAFTFSSLRAQPAPSLPAGDVTCRYVWVPETNSLPKFDLNFPGGKPQQLIDAVEKTTGKPLNTVIPDDCKGLQIAPFSVKAVTVAQLFEALKRASRKTERFMVDRPDNNWGFETCDLIYGFSTPGVPDENSIWYFSRNGEPGSFQTVSATVCRFYQLSPYLNTGYKVEDITATVEAAWKMLGSTNSAALNYQKKTGILIATGEWNRVYLVGDVLTQLSTGKLKGQVRN